MKRVLFVDQSGQLGGAELSLLDIATRFRDRGRVVLLGDGPFRRRLEDRGIDVSILPTGKNITAVSKTGSSWSQALAVPQLLSSAFQLSKMARSYDVLYANTQKAFVLAAIAAVIARRPLIWHLRDLLTTDHFSNVNLRIVIVLANLIARRVISNSQATADAFVSAGGRKRKVLSIHNGVDSTAFDQTVDSADMQEVLGFKATNMRLVGVFGRLAKWKGQHVLLEAVGGIPNVALMVVGDAVFQDDHIYADSLKQQARTLGIEHRVHFLGFRDDVPALMKACDVIVHCSTSPEPFGRVIVEGMLAGKPVIASDAGGAREIVTDGVDGLLTPPGDSGALAGAIRRLLDNPQEAAKMAANGQRTARERFNLAKVLDQIEAVVESVVNKR